MPNDNSSLMHLCFGNNINTVIGKLFGRLQTKKFKLKIQTLYRNSNLIEIFRNGLRANVFLFRLKKIEISFIY